MKAIIKALKRNPGKDIFQIAKKLSVTPLEVSHAQHEYLKQFRSKHEADDN